MGVLVLKYRCTVCNYIYDEEKEGTLFADLPRDWVCPSCGAPLSAFEPIGAGTAEETGIKTTVADKIVEQLSAAGVKYIFGIPGESNLPLMEAIRKSTDVDFMLTRHEETAAFMASAHAKITGHIGVCLSIAGPGTTNLITGLVDATSDGAPVLALTGQVAQPYLGSEYLQEIDEIEIFAPFTVFNETIASPGQAVRLTTLAIKHAYAKRATAHLSLPTDVLGMPLDDSIWQPEKHVFSPKTIPLEQDMVRAVEAINNSIHPIVFAGWGIREGGSEVIALAEKIQAFILTTSRAKGEIPEDHPLAMGVLGSIGTPYAAQAAREGDLFIVLGSGFRQRNLVPDTPIIQVDINAARVGRSFPVDVGLVGDAILTVNELTKRVTPKLQDPGYFETIDDIRSDFQEMILDESKDMSIPINPGFLVQSVKLHADRDAYICIDVGDHTYWFYKKYQCTGEKTLMSSNMASMGFGLPAALAACLEYPGRQVICITGDGGFAMVMADFTTAVRNNLPVKVILFNDGKLKNIKKEQEMYDYPEYGIQFKNPDFAAFAVSCGGEGYRVENPEELDEALEKAFNSDKPTVVDVLVDPARMAPIVLRPP